jgi:hypothetical protein
MCSQTCEHLFSKYINISLFFFLTFPNEDNVDDVDFLVGPIENPYLPLRVAALPPFAVDPRFFFFLVGFFLGLCYDCCALTYMPLEICDVLSCSLSLFFFFFFFFVGVPSILLYKYVEKCLHI